MDERFDSHDGRLNKAESDIVSINGTIENLGRTNVLFAGALPAIKGESFVPADWRLGEEMSAQPFFFGLYKTWANENYDVLAKYEELFNKFDLTEEEVTAALFKYGFPDNGERFMSNDIMRAAFFKMSCVNPNGTKLALRNGKVHMLRLTFDLTITNAMNESAPVKFSLHSHYDNAWKFAIETSDINAMDDVETITIDAIVDLSGKESGATDVNLFLTAIGVERNVHDQSDPKFPAFVGRNVSVAARLAPSLFN